MESSLQPIAEFKERRLAQADEVTDTALFHRAESIARNFVARKAIFVCELDQGSELHLTRGNEFLLFFIKAGQLTLSIPSSFPGAKEYFVAWRGPGHVIGEVSPFTKIPQPIKVTALTSCTLLEIPSPDFIELAEKYAVLYENLVQLMIKKAKEERSRWDVIFSIKKPIHQVAYVLLKLAQERGTDGDKQGYEVIRGLVRHQDIAGYLGWGRTNVHRYIKQLKVLGLAEGGMVGRRNAVARLFNIQRLEDFVMENTGAVP